MIADRLGRGVGDAAEEPKDAYGAYRDARFVRGSDFTRAANYGCRPPAHDNTLKQVLKTDEGTEHHHKVGMNAEQQAADE